MLPDLKTVKRELESHIAQYLRNRAKNSPFFKDIATHFIHEGNRTRTVRSDGTQDEGGLKQSTGEIEIRKEELYSMTPHERIAKLDEMSDQMLAQMTTHVLESLSEITEKYGQTVKGNGEGFTVDKLFASLEKMDVQFDEHGRPNQINLYGGPPGAIQKIMDEIEASPELMRRHNDIFERKCREFRDREANRKLVG